MFCSCSIVIEQKENARGLDVDKFFWYRARVMQKSLRLSLNGESNRVCDILAEMLVEEYTRRDASTRCRLSVFGGEGMVMVAGFVQSRADLDIAALISKTYTELTGKEDIEPFVHITQTEKEGFDRSSWIHNDMGVAYGFATQETPEGLPFPLVVAQQVKRHTADARLIDPACQFLGYDGEIVVTTEGKRVTSLQLELEHPSTMNPSDVQQVVYERILTPLLHPSHATRVEVRGRGVVPSGFSYMPGASGVSTSMMTYGGLLPEASHAFVGHDIYAPARLATYEARRLAKHTLHVTGAPSVLVQLPYAQGRIQIDRVRAVTGAGEDVSEMLKSASVDIEALVQKFDLAKAPLRLLAEHHQFVPELAPWEILFETL